MSAELTGVRFNADAFLFHLAWWYGGAKRPRRTRAQVKADYRTRAQVFRFLVAQCEAEIVAGIEPPEPERPRA